MGTLSRSGNIFLTNIHRVYQKTEKESSINDDNLMDYFLGEKPVTNAQDNKVSVSDIVRDINELIVINDEAHHVHDSKLAWFKSIQDIHNTMLQKEVSYQYKLMFQQLLSTKMVIFLFKP